MSENLPVLPALPEVTSPLEMWIAGWELASDGSLRHGPVLRVELQQMELDMRRDFEEVGFPWEPVRLVPVREEWSAAVQFDGDGRDVIPALRPWNLVAVRVYDRRRRRVIQFAAVMTGWEVSELRRMRQGRLLLEGEIEQHTRFQMLLVDVSEQARWHSEPRQLPAGALALPSGEPR
jgi:hypothetical protein